jgi:hypothetical protein
MGQYRAVMEPLGRALREFAPETTLRITGGDLRLAPLDLRKLDIALDTSAEGFTLDLNAASRLWSRLSLKGRVTYADLAARVDAELDGLDLPQALALAGVRTGGSEPIESAAGRVSAKANLALGTSWQAELAIVKSDVALKLAQLPGPVGLSRGSARAVPGKATLEKVGLSLLDSSVLASASYDKQKSALQLAITDGVAGEKLVRWALEQGGVPARFEQKTPLRLTAKRLAWAPNKPLEVDARAALEGGPQVEVALVLRPEQVDLKRIAIKDAGSNAVLSAAIAGDLIRATFTGVLHGRSIAALLRDPPRSGFGIVQGNLRLTVDRAQPRRSVASGNLRPLARPDRSPASAIVERVELTADETIVCVATHGPTCEQCYPAATCTPRRAS